MDNESNKYFTLPGYKITEKLYESRCTLVYRGARIKNGERVVLKILKPQASVEKDEITHFRHESDIILKLNQSGVVNSMALVGIPR